MEKLQTPVVAGMGGAAVLAALLSFGGGDAKKPAAPQASPAVKQPASDDVVKGSAPNQEGPWRAICEEYAPNGAYKNGPTGIPRGYRIVRRPSHLPEEEDTIEVNTARDAHGRTHKIAVHKQLIGDLVPCIPSAQLSGLRLIIATVPDPDKTEMRLEFDRYIEALEKAAAIRGFHFTGYWFPWKPRQDAPAPHKEDEIEAALLRAEQPGILLFHNDQGRRLFLFVVGETPTSGIDRLQMAQALRYRKALIDASSSAKLSGKSGHAAKRSRKPTDSMLNGPLMISGPHFSGALQSLGEVLEGSNFLASRIDTSRASQIRIVSPDVGSGPLIDVFNKTYCKQSYGCGFRSLAMTTEEEDELTSKYLKSLGYRKSQIAQLIEDESGLGDSEGRIAPEDSAGKTTLEDSGGSQKLNLNSGGKPAANQKSAVTGNPALGASPRREYFGLMLTFPRELSAVRSLSDQQSEQLAASGSKLLSFSRNSIPIKLAGQEPVERDRPSTYAFDEEASEISSALENDVRVLRERGIECVVVTATNPLDRVFLLEYIHDRLPNIRIVAQQADALELSHPHFVDLTGTIVISLPTVAEFAAVKNAKPVAISFASVAAEEQFLSTAILLDSEVMKRDIAKDQSEDMDAEKNADIREDGWGISIVGEKAFSLVPFEKLMAASEQKGTTLVFGEDVVNKGQLIDEITNKSDDGVTLEITNLENTPRPFISFSLVIFLLTVLHLVWLFNSEAPDCRKAILKFAGESPRHDRQLKSAYVEPGGSGDFNRTYNLQALNSQLLLLNGLVLAVNPVLNPFHEGLEGLRWIAAGAWVTTACMGAATALSLARYWGNLKAALKEIVLSLAKYISNPEAEKARDVIEKISVLLFTSLMLCYLLSSIVFLCRWRGTAIMEWRRILDIDGGLSPIVPIAAILLAWGLWAALQLRRVKWIAHRKMDPLIPEISLEKGSLGGHICKDIKAIQDKIDPPTIGLAMVLFVLGFVAIVAPMQWASLRGIEPYSPWDGDLLRLILHIFFPPGFEWWFGIWGLVMLLMTVMQTAYQLRQIWRSLERLLHRLEPTRMKLAFEQIGKDDHIHIKLWDLGKAQMRFDEMALIIESLRAMGHGVEADTAQEKLAVYQNSDLEGRQPTQDDRDELNKALNACMKEALEGLDEKAKEPQGIEILFKPFWGLNTGLDAGHLEKLDRYLALRISTLVRYVLLQMRNLMWFVIYGYFLAVVAVTFYPFQGGKNLSDMLAVTFAIVLVIMAVLVIEVLRNPMLKRLESGGENAASILQACIHLLSVGGLPALALLGWQFPWLGQLAFSWLRPLLSAFR